MDEEIARQKFMEMQMLGEQIKQIHAQLEVIQNKKLELDKSIENIGNIKNMPQDSKLLTPVADGIFLRGELKTNDNVLVNVGAGIVVKKSIEDAQALLREKQGELQQYETEMQNELQKVEAHGKNLEKELEKIVK